MTKLVIFISIMIPQLLCSQILITRDILGACGAQITGSVIQFSYTVGETFTSTLMSNEIHTLGFQQSEINSLNTSELAFDEYLIFPNPATKSITVKSINEHALNYKIMDLTGRLIMIGTNEINFTLTIDCTSLMEGEYIFEGTNSSGITSCKRFIIKH